MAIISVPGDVRLDGRVACSICQQRITLDKATVGLLAAGNRQAFACNHHFLSSAQYILGWADFLVAQRTAMRHGTQTGTGA